MGALSGRSSVLVRLPSWLGDAVAAEPALRSLVAATDDGRRLSMALPKALEPLFEGTFPNVRRIVHAGRSGERAADWRGHDVAVLFTGSFRSAWTAWRAGIPRRVGWSRDGRAWLLSDRMRPALERGAVALGCGRKGSGRRYLPRPFGASCSELLGLLGLPVSDSTPRLEPSVEARARVERRLARLGIERPFVLASVGSRPASAKAYPSASWGAVLERLGEGSSLPLVLVFGPAEEPLAREVQGRAPRVRLFGPPAADLPELVALCALSELVIAADGGVRHVAHASGAPVVSVMGPSDPRHTQDLLLPPRSNLSQGGRPASLLPLLRVVVPCGPCHRELCPLQAEAHHRCMRRIDPAHVADAVGELVRGRGVVR